MSTDLKISQLTPATTVNTNDYTVMVDGNTSANKRATVAQILAIAGAGTVTSINVSGANGINSSGGPITSSGTIALSLGAITPTSIVASGTISGSNLSNTNSGDQAITIVGDVTAPASTGTLTATLANSVVTNDKLADMVGPTVKGRTSGTGIPQDLSTAQVTAMLPEMVADSGTGGSKGLVPPPTAGSAAAKKFLRADATWVATDLNDILPSQSGNIGKVLQTSGTTTSWQAVGVGSVTNVSVTTANGVSGSVANSSTVPAISLTLGAITPTSVNSVVVSGTSTPTLAVTGTSSISGSNTGDQTTITGNAGSATALATGRTISITGDLAYTSPSFDGSGNVTAAGTLASVASAGTTGGSTAIPIVTINAKGLTTSITTAAVIAPAGTLSGNTLASGVTASSLTSLGTIANLAVTAGTISGTPSASTDIANKLYVDTVAQGLDAKASCVAATTADITLSGTQTIDGISVIAGNRVLVKNQTLSQNNGIYLCAAGAWTRTTDADTWDELTSAFTFIETGTVNADTGYVCTANAGGTLGTTALPWSQFSGAGSYTASTGLTLTGTVFSLTAPVTVALGGTNATSAGIASFNNITGYTASGATGTTSTNLVFSTSPTITSPTITGGALNGTLGATTPSTVAATTISGTNITASGSLLWGSGGTYAAGSIYADANWGAIIRAKTASPASADFAFQNSVGTELARLNTTGLAVTGAVTVDPSSGISIDAINNAATYALRIRRTNTTNRNWGMYVDSGGLLKFDDITGAVTPLSLSATGAAISGTLSATGAITNDGYGITQNTASYGYWFGASSTRASGVYSTAGLDVKIRASSTEVASFTSTGLAVTGTLSASGSFTASNASKNESGNYIIGGLLGGATYLDSANSGDIYIRPNGTQVGQFSTTGLAVTGTGTFSSTIGLGSGTPSANVAIKWIGSTGYVFSDTTVNGKHWQIGPNVGSSGNDDTWGFYSYTAANEILQLTTGGAVVKGALSCTGALSKGSGSFRIEHPLPSKSATHQLVHSFIEGPKCDLIYRGKVDLVDGKASVNIDADSTMTEGTFEALCATVQCFTSNESGWGAIRGKVVGNILTIEAQDAASTDNVSWMVIGERKDKHIMDTDWTDKNGRPIVEPLKPAEPALESK